MSQSEIHFTLTDEAAVEFIRGKVRSGEYASESDVVNDGLLALKEESEEREHWEHEVLVPAHDRLMANVSSAVPIEQLERDLEARRRRRLKAS